MNPTTRPTHSCRPRLARMALPLLAVLAAGLLSSCGEATPMTPPVDQAVDYSAEIRLLEARINARFEEMGNALLAVAAQADRAAFWQTVSAVLLFIGGIAFVGGAALGSKARRDRLPEMAVLADPVAPHQNGSRSRRHAHPNHARADGPNQSRHESVA